MHAVEVADEGSKDVGAWIAQKAQNQSKVFKALLDHVTPEVGRAKLAESLRKWAQDVKALLSDANTAEGRARLARALKNWVMTAVSSGLLLNFGLFLVALHMSTATVMDRQVHVKKTKAESFFKPSPAPTPSPVPKPAPAKVENVEGGAEGQKARLKRQAERAERRRIRQRTAERERFEASKAREKLRVENLRQRQERDMQWKVKRMMSVPNEDGGRTEGGLDISKFGAELTAKVSGVMSAVRLNADQLLDFDHIKEALGAASARIDAFTDHVSL